MDKILKTAQLKQHRLQVIDIILKDSSFSGEHRNDHKKLGFEETRIMNWLDTMKDKYPQYSDHFFY